MEGCFNISDLEGTIFWNSMMRTFGAKIGDNVIINEANGDL